MNDDLISREALKKKLQARHDNGEEDFDKGYNIGIEAAIELLDNAPTVELDITEKQAILTIINSGWLVKHDKELREKYERPQGEYVDISKLRLMTVEECAGHTIDYAMGWKACVEWIKKGSAE